MKLQTENEDQSSRFDYDHLFKKILWNQIPQTNEKTDIKQGKIYYELTEKTNATIEK